MLRLYRLSRLSSWIMALALAVFISTAIQWYRLASSPLHTEGSFALRYS
jgi:hypothetical protein